MGGALTRYHFSPRSLEQKAETRCPPLRTHPHIDLIITPLEVTPGTRVPLFWLTGPVGTPSSGLRELRSGRFGKPLPPPVSGWGGGRDPLWAPLPPRQHPGGGVPDTEEGRLEAAMCPL